MASFHLPNYTDGKRFIDFFGIINSVILTKIGASTTTLIFSLSAQTSCGLYDLDVRKSRLLKDLAMIIALFLYKYLTADWLLNKICDFINKICLSLG